MTDQPTETRRPTFAIGAGEVAGSVADLGVFIPLASALILVNGLDGGMVLIAAGALVIASGAVFRIPWPVQPLKALSALAIALQLDPEMIRAAGLELGAALLVLSIPAVARPVARLFTITVVRALQVGVGLLLVVSAARLVVDPPAAFAGAPRQTWAIALAVVSFAVIAWAVHKKRYGVVVVVVATAVAIGAVAGLPQLGVHGIELSIPALPRPASFVACFLLLVVPQIPLTIGNAVVAVTETSHEYFGGWAARVTPSRVAMSAGLGNIVSALIGGMPMCHGAGGLTAHHRLGARTAGMNLLLGGAFVASGVFFGASMPELLGSIPPWVLGALLAYVGIRHALLALDLRGVHLVVAAGAGIAGALTGNLAITAGVTIAFVHAPQLLTRLLKPLRPAADRASN